MTTYISEEESLKETMNKFGYVYADVNRRRIQMKIDFYTRQGFKTHLKVLSNGFYLGLEF